MSRVMKVIGLVALFWMLFPAAAESGEKKVRPGGDRKEGQAAGIRGLFIDKGAIAERAQDRAVRRPPQENPHAGRGFLLEKIQGGRGRGKLALKEMRQRQLERYERRPVVKTRGAIPAGKERPGTLSGAHKPDVSQESGGYSGIVCAFGVLAVAAFVVLRRRAGRQGGREKKKARGLY
jgi:hypothetical protein